MEIFYVFHVCVIIWEYSNNILRYDVGTIYHLRHSNRLVCSHYSLRLEQKNDRIIPTINMLHVRMPTTWADSILRLLCISTHNKWACCRFSLSSSLCLFLRVDGCVHFCDVLLETYPPLYICMQYSTTTRHTSSTFEFCRGCVLVVEQKQKHALVREDITHLHRHHMLWNMYSWPYNSDPCTFCMFVCSMWVFCKSDLGPEVNDIAFISKWYRPFEKKRTTNSTSATTHTKKHTHHKSVLVIWLCILNHVRAPKHWHLYYGCTSTFSTWKYVYYVYLYVCIWRHYCLGIFRTFHLTLHRNVRPTQHNSMKRKLLLCAPVRIIL